MTTTDSPVVIGLDTSLTATGIASSRGWCQAIGWTDKKNPLTKQAQPERLGSMLHVLQSVIEAAAKPDLVVMELPALSRTGGGGHERGWLWWEIYRHFAAVGIPIGLLTPNQRALYATGKGAAAKGAVIDAVARRWPNWNTEGDDNCADAVALMAAGRDWAGHPIAVMPQTHRRAIDAAAWPDLSLLTLTGDPS